MQFTDEQAQNKTSDLRRDQTADERRTNAHRGQRLRRASPVNGSQQIRTSGDDWQKADCINTSGHFEIGGILDRLIDKTQKLINESETRTADLKKHLSDLRHLSSQLQSIDEDS